MAKLSELAHESPATTGSAEHVHVASNRYWRLRRIAHVAKHKYGLSVREFWPYDDIDPVHANCSWHYRWPGKAQQCAAARTGADRQKRNLALDASGPLDKEREFFTWVLSKYGRPSGWYVPFG